MKNILFFWLSITVFSVNAQFSLNNKYVDADSISSLKEKKYYFNNNPYDLSFKKELIFAIPITALVIADLEVKAKQFTQEDLAALNTNNIPWFERNIIYFDTATATRADELSDLFNKSAILIGVTSVLIPACDFPEMFTNLFIYYEGIMINSGITDLLKKSVGRVRPYAYNTSLPDEYRMNGAVNSSFPSGHTSSSAFSCFFAAKMIDDYLIDDENRLLKTINWTTAALIPAWVGYLRMAAGVHFLTDVAAGYVIGASCGFFIPVLHKSKYENISLAPALWNEGNGLSCTIKF